MTLAERATLGRQVHQQIARKRADALRQEIEQGEGIKRAAWRVGVSYRTACRYRRQASAAA